MSTKAFDHALDFMPEAAATASRRTSPKFWATLFQALSDGRSAEAEYRRQIARGVEPQSAIKAAFNVGYKTR